MTASEFVKKFGWDDAKKLIDSVKLKVTANGVACIPCFILADGEHLGYDDLKRLVASYKLVQSHGGLEKIKEKIKINAIWQDGGKPTITLLKQAIADVESCIGE